MDELNLTLAGIKSLYQSKELTPRTLCKQLRQKARDYSDYNLFIHLLTEAELEPYLNRLEQMESNSLPLWGVPFVVKDNIDLAGIPTTAACAEFSYTPKVSATVVKQLIDAGAIPIAKANMDQFATGLVGTRSPYGVCHNAFDFSRISGGSSSGSAVSLALNLCSFSLGTDTAGSGRVPAAFNNLIGLKPSKGLLSTRGVVPAVRSQDVVNIFTLNSQDAACVLDIAANYDAEDEFSRKEADLMPPAWPNKPVIGVPDQASLFFDGDEQAEKSFQSTLSQLKILGYQIKEVPFQAWIETAKLLYGGAWVAERYLAIEEFFTEHEQQMDPTVSAIIAGARNLTAAQAYQGSYALQKAQRTTQQLWQTHQIDCFMTPTTPSIYTIEAVQKDPITLNSKLGTYTNFMNLLDYAAVAMPTEIRADHLPTGVTFFAPAGSDRSLLALTDQLHREFIDVSGARGLSVPNANPEFFSDFHTIPLAVVGAHLVGFPLNGQLKERGAKLLETTQTAAKYRFYELEGGPILKPGLVKQSHNGHAIEVEIWAMPTQHLGSFLALIPSPLGLGKVELIDGRQVVGFICEPYGIESASDISHSGGWRNWMQSKLE